MSENTHANPNFIEGTIHEAKSVVDMIKDNPATKTVLVYGAAFVGALIARNMLKTKSVVVEIDEEIMQEEVKVPDGTTTTTTTSHKKASTKEH